MSEKFDLSRRKVLGGLGTIGAASAFGGAGTMAFFSDEEEFANNQLVAGELDLKVDWEEHYSDWSDDEANHINTVSMEPADDLVGFPSTAPLAERSVFVSDPDQFLTNTAIEAFPDVTNDSQDYDGQKERFENDSDICDLPADTDGGGGVLSHPYRTRGTFGGDPNPQTTEEGDPLVNISDVKPGDFGEVTFSFHICGNPGYVWLTGDLVDADENGYTEPELDDNDEVTADDYDGDGSDLFDNEGDEDDDGNTVQEPVELLDEIRAAFWYDTGPDGSYGADFDDKDDGEGDNYFDDGETLIPVMGTLRNVLTVLQDRAVPLDAEPIEPASGGGTGSGDAPTVSGEITDSNTYIQEIIVTGDDPRFDEGPSGGTPRNYQCADYEEKLGISGIFGAEIIDTDDGLGINEGMTYQCCTQITVNTYDSVDNGTVTISSEDPVRIVSVKGGPNGEQIYVFSEPVFLDNATFTTPGNYNISNIDVCCPVDGNGGGGEDGEGRQCFPNSTTAYIGFEWWLPVDHGNEIQGDSVSFDLGFYTEQCRHNDGSGGPSS